MADVFGNDSAVDPRMDDVLHPAEVTILGVGNVILGYPSDGFPAPIDHKKDYYRIIR